MDSNEELKVQEKQELEQAGESTTPARFFVPQADIFEDNNALTMKIEMPGVDKDNISIDLEQDKLSIEGRINFSNYEGMEPIHIEYEVGHYRRGFILSDRIDREKISANLIDGVFVLVLPKAEAVKPKRITVS